MRYYKKSFIEWIASREINVVIMLFIDRTKLRDENKHGSLIFVPSKVANSIIA